MPRQFCSNCGSPVVARLEPEGAPKFVKAGTMDDISDLKSQLHCSTKSTQSWVDMGELPQFATVPEGL